MKYLRVNFRGHKKSLPKSTLYDVSQSILSDEFFLSYKWGDDKKKKRKNSYNENNKSSFQITKFCNCLVSK